MIDIAARISFFEFGEGWTCINCRTKKVMKRGKDGKAKVKKISIKDILQNLFKM